MFRDLASLREPLLAARLLREEILGTPLPPETTTRLRAALLREGVGAAARPAFEVAAARAGDPSSVVTREALVAIAAAAGGGGERSHGGVVFHGKPAPAPGGIGELLDELLETVNSPIALESWPAPVRAFGLHFLLRLVQPFDAPPEIVGPAAESMLLVADGFAPDRMLLPEPDAGCTSPSGKPDPDAFVRERTHRLVERLGDARDRVREAAARWMMAAWASQRSARLNPRQSRLVRWLAERDDGGRIAFQDYVDLHAGRRAPSVRSLQRDFQRLRERGLLREEGGAFVLETRTLTFGG